MKTERVELIVDNDGIIWSESMIEELNLEAYS
jgi:hypothetical protein